MLKLVGTDGARYYSWPLEPGRYVVGRSDDADITIPHRTVSRRHAELVVDDDGRTVSVEDLGSHNGTLVNGRRISVLTGLAVDDAIVFGQTEFSMTEGDNEISRPAFPTTATLAEHDPEKSVYLSIREALKPLPEKVTEQPNLLPTLFEMAKLLASPDPKEEVLQRGLELIARVIPSQRLAVLFVSENQEDVYAGAVRLADGAGDPGAFQLSRTIVNEIMTNQNAILIGDPMDDPRFAAQQSIIMSELKSALAVPLFDEGKVLGILYADTTSPAHRYDNEHLRVLATFGNMVAAKLLSYSLLNERQEKHLVERELARASAIQKRLLVTQPPAFPGFEICAFQEQSRSVGGDLYDMKLLDDGRLLLLVADVSGKGMGAALLMSNILASFRILYESKPFDVCRAVKQVSRQILAFSDPGDFATLYMALLEPSGRMCFINAGHNPPLLVRRNGDLEKLQPSGIMIGAFDGMDWAQQEIMLEPGDLVFTFSDGVTEAERDGRQFGDGRTEKLVVDSRTMSADDLVEHLMDEINRHMGDAPRSDDITVLAVKRKLA
ncbi:MAG: SpoIIE family protein phosphatase [bacterium]